MLVDDNLSMFRDQWPEIYETFKRVDLSRAKLINLDGDWDVEINRQRLYNGGARAFSEKQVAEFWDQQPNRIHLSVPQPDQFGGILNQFVIGLLRDSVDRKISFFEKRCDLRSDHLVVLGIGLAEHLPRLVDLLECKTLIIVEPNIDLFRASLETFDWVAFNRRFPKDDGCRINFILLNDGQQAYDYVRSIIKFQKAPAFLDGFCLFQHYETEVFQHLGQKIFSFPRTLFSDIGYLNDNLNMLQNTYFNLRDLKPKIFQGNQPRVNFPALIVGAGPSLDNAFDTIRKYADQAMIVSCGTALGALLDQGIVPDYHVEMENVLAVYDAVKSVEDRHSLSGITLVCSTTIHPSVPVLFDDVIMFFRRGLCAYPIFAPGPESEIPNASLIVSNLGASFAREAGCHEVYFFGVDLGTRDTDYHHAKNTPYLRGEIDFVWHEEPELERPANFGGIAYTHELYLEVQAMHEEDIRHHGTDRVFYNCSDGVKIAGMVPLPPENVAFAGDLLAKKDGIRKITEAAHRYQKDEFSAAWNGADRLRENRELAAKLIGFLTEAGDEYNDVLSGMRKINDYLAENLDLADTSTYQSSMTQGLAAAYFYLCRTGNDEDRKKFSAVVRDQLIVLIHTISDTLDWLYELLKDPEIAVLGAHVEDEWMLPPR